MFLEEMLWLEGLCGHYSDRCPCCPRSSCQKPKYQCKDCLGEELLCDKCCVAAYSDNPFHMIEVRFPFSGLDAKAETFWWYSSGEIDGISRKQCCTNLASPFKLDTNQVHNAATLNSVLWIL